MKIYTLDALTSKEINGIIKKAQNNKSGIFKFDGRDVSIFYADSDSDDMIASTEFDGTGRNGDGFMTWVNFYAEADNADIDNIIECIDFIYDDHADE